MIERTNDMDYRLHASSAMHVAIVLVYVCVSISLYSYTASDCVSCFVCIIHGCEFVVETMSILSCVLV